MKNNGFPCVHRYLPLQCAILGLAFTAVLAGCGPTISPVTGTVTYKGEKVKGGTLIFAPVGEGNVAPGVGQVKDDGTYELKTDNAAGTIVGKARVSYTAPEGEASKDPKKEGIPSPYAGLEVKTPDVEVKSGANKIDIELVPATPKKKG